MPEWRKIMKFHSKKTQKIISTIIVVLLVLSMIAGVVVSIVG